MTISNINHAFEPALTDLRSAFAADPVIRYFVATLLTANLALILIHVIFGASYQLGWLPNPLPDRWNISREGSVAEYLNHFQTAVCAALVFACWHRARIHARLVWALVFVFVLADDSLGYHETIGRLLSATLPAMDGIAPEEIGEIVAWMIAGVILAVPMVAALRQPQSRTDPLSKLLLASFASLVFFAVVMDFVHELTNGTRVGHFAGVIEDGGEMLSLAFACMFAFIFFRRRL